MSVECCSGKARSSGGLTKAGSVGQRLADSGPADAAGQAIPLAQLVRKTPPIAVTPSSSQSAAAAKDKGPVWGGAQVWCISVLWPGLLSIFPCRRCWLDQQPRLDRCLLQGLT